jgi:uncharacterized protein affecting Mg2+/Co2+ transport
MSKKQCDIRIHVATDYIDNQSEPDADRYVFAYTRNIDESPLDHYGCQRQGTGSKR